MNAKRLEAAAVNTLFVPTRSEALQRKCACGKHSPGGAECPACKKSPLDLQRKSLAEGATLGAPAIVHEVLLSPGQPLDPAAQAFFESRFDRDFSRVRIHADDHASASAQAVGARAYTVGSDIVFGSGEYRPRDVAGQRLLAHELTHTVQQANVSGVAPQTRLEVGSADTPLEREADRLAEQVMANSSDVLSPSRGGVSRSVLSPARPTLQRDEQKTEKPLIPIPVFDELDPMVIVPDVPGVPSILRGQTVKLSTLRSALDALRGKLPSLGGPAQDFCSKLLPGYETANGGDVDGQCCPQHVRESARCCRWQDLGFMSFRCCGRDEVVINNRCVQPQPAPKPAPKPVPAQGGTTFPTIPRLELQFPQRIRFGTIESDTIDRFALNRPELPSTAAAKLDHLAGLLKIYRDAEIHIEGHTDSSYTEEYNQALSERRAQAVRSALTRRGVDGKRIVTQGFGETRLLFPSESNEEEKAKNRRVDVWFHIPPSRRLGEGLHIDPFTAPLPAPVP